MTADMFLAEILKISERLPNEEITAWKMVEWLLSKVIEDYDLTD